jgi:hypothetical protein
MASPSPPPSGDWTRAELLAAQAEGALLDVVAPGLTRCAIVTVRERDVVVATRFHATAYVQFGAIRSAPQRFAPGDKVATPYGSGVVTEARAPTAAAGGCRSVVVKFLDKGAVGASRRGAPSRPLRRARGHRSSFRRLAAWPACPAAGSSSSACRGR